MLCLECGEGELEEDGQGAELTLVCTQCGFVDKNSASHSMIPDEYICNSGDQERKKIFRADLKDATSKRKYYLKKYFADIEHCVSQCTQSECISASISKESNAVFFKLIYDNSLQHKSNPEKLRIAAACVYIILRQHGISITLRSVGEAIGAPLFGLYSSFTLVKSLTNLDVPGIKECDVTKFMESLPCVTVSNDLAKKSLEMHRLLEKMFLTQGRDHQTVAYVAIYFANVSQQKKTKKCISFPIFCKSNRIKSSSAAIRLVKTCKERLLVLAERLPWITDKCNRSCRFHLFIDDILRYQDTLLNGGPSPTDYSENEIESTRMPPAFLKEPKVKIPVSSGEMISTVSTSETLTEDDLPESEMINYLRTAHEIEQLQMLQEIANKDSVD